MNPDLSGIDIFTDDEMNQIVMWQDEQSAIFDALQAGVPLWELVPIERIPSGTLAPDQLKQAAVDPERATLNELADEERQFPVLKALREEGAGWLDRVQAQRLSALGVVVADESE